MDRRQILSLFVKGIGVSMASVMAVPVILHSLSPVFSQDSEESWSPLGPLENFPMGQIVPAVATIFGERGSLNKKMVYVWRKENQDFVIYSRSCTDLGCPLNYDPGSEWFFCPCHGGIFDKNGDPRAGPPNKPLWKYNYRIINKVLEIDLRSVPPMV